MSNRTIREIMEVKIEETLLMKFRKELIWVMGTHLGWKKLDGPRQSGRRSEDVDGKRRSTSCETKRGR